MILPFSMLLMNNTGVSEACEGRAWGVADTAVEVDTS